MEGTGMLNGTAARQEGRKLWQYLSSISVCMLAAAVGTAMAWTSPVLPQLYQEDSWLVITKEQGSWIGCLCAVGAIVGSLPAGSMADKLGRKKSLMLLSVPFLLSWGIIIVSSHVWMLYVARLIVGVGVGAACVLVPNYICEIAETTARGVLGAMFQFFLTVGILFAFIVGSTLSYSAFAIICALVVMVFLGSFVWMLESPVWLVASNQSQSRDSDAAVALSVLRGDVYDPAEELADMRRALEETPDEKPSIIDMARMPHTRKALIISLGAMFFQQMSGVNAVIFYTVAIFEASGSTMPAALASIIVATVQTVMSGVAAVIVDRAGRKPLLMISSVVMSLSLLALGFYFNQKNSGNDVTSLGWLPVSSLTLFMIAFSIGMGPIPWMLMAELFTSDTKAVASGVAVMFNWFMVFVVTKTFPTMNQELGADTTFWIFAAVMALATAFTHFVIIETKGKSFQEIQDALRGLAAETKPSA